MALFIIFLSLELLSIIHMQQNLHVHWWLLQHIFLIVTLPDFQIKQETPALF